MQEKMLGKNGLLVDVPSSYDNISEQGDVLYLDEERLRRKERHDKPVFQNHPHGLGVKDAFWTRFSARPWNFGGYAAAFHAMRGILHWSAKEMGPQGNLMRSVLMMNSDRGYSGGTAFNLNVDLADKANNTVIPMDLVKRAIDKADYVAAMDKCLCRTANNCQRVPHDIACMFLGKGGRTVADHRIAHEITKEQAYAKIERAAAEGLVCMSLWVQVEQLVWGIRNQEMSDMVEICFCCPCCCTALNLCKETTPDIRRRFTPSGFTATVDHDLCIACHKCVGDGDKAYCPMDAIQFRGSDNKMVVNQEMCIGCGYCKERCPVGAIRIQQTMPMRESMHDYFIEETRLDLAVDGYPGPGAK